jgi:AcrR family transcriptional regulator
MSSDAEAAGARAPKRQRGRQRVAELLQAATEVFAEKGYEAATMTEIAARAGAPIGSLYQFFPAKEVLADTLVQGYLALLAEDLTTLEVRAGAIDTAALVQSLFKLLSDHPRERAAALPLAEVRMDARTRRAAFRPMLRRHIAAILRARAPELSAESARDMATVVLALMKAASTLDSEEGLSGRAAAQGELQAITMRYLEERIGSRP